jgi:cobalt-zinc-cadmium efflux system membrane fusion protein
MINIDPVAVLEGKLVSQIDFVSPFSGFVSALNLTRGMYVSPGDVLLEIIDNSHLHLALYVYETDAMKLKEGQDIRFRVTQSGNDFYEGEVIMVGKSVEGADRKVIVYGKIVNTDSSAFISGMFVEAEVFVRQRISCGLPNEAIANEGGKKFVFVLKSSDSENLVFEKRYVETGQTSEDLTEIFCHNDSCTVLVKGAFNLAEGN